MIISHLHKLGNNLLWNRLRKHKKGNAIYAIYAIYMFIIIDKEIGKIIR